MKPTSLTRRPRAPALVRATAIGTLALAPVGCGDDDDGTTAGGTDQFPTAGPCAHDPSSPGCETTSGLTPMTGTETEVSTSTGATSSADAATDQFPTAGPCAHDPDSPVCASSSGTDSSGSDDSSTGSTGTSTSG